MSKMELAKKLLLSAKELLAEEDIFKRFDIDGLEGLLERIVGVRPKFKAAFDGKRLRVMYEIVNIGSLGKLFRHTNISGTLLMNKGVLSGLMEVSWWGLSDDPKSEQIGYVQFDSNNKVMPSWIFKRY